MRVQLSPGSQIVNALGMDARTISTVTRRHTLGQFVLAAAAKCIVVVVSLLAGILLPAAVHAAATIRGTIFEDLNYGGGAGRGLLSSDGVICTDARVELFNGTTGVFRAQSTLDSLGGYKFNGLPVGDYIVRVVTQTVTSSRTGYIPGTHLAVPTFRTDASLGVASPVTNEVGGHEPTERDANNAGSGDQIDINTFQFIVGPSGYAQTGARVNVPSVNAVVSAIDFGFNFDVITNTNDLGAGSLRQFLFNADGLDNIGLSQDGFASDTEHAIWMISNGTSAGGLRADHDYFTAGVASIATQTALPVIVDPVVLDAGLQPGYSGTPVVVIDGSASGPGVNGLELLAPGCEVRGLTIGGFNGSGIVVSAIDCLIAGNWIGLDATGSAALGNLADGITVWSDGAIIGGGAPEDRNVVSGNGADGIRVEFTSSGSSIRGNWVGTDARGSSAIPNGGITTPSAGIEVNGDNSVVGGATPDERNIVSGNTDAGVRLSGFASVLLGNSIGVDVNGTALGNSGIGVFVSADFGGASLELGGVNIEDGNIIANNGGNGIELDPLAGEGIAILSNNIFENGGLGIDLAGDGITTNDPLDTDFGPNSLQNYPELTLARTSDVNVHVQGTLSGDPDTRFRIEFFASANADPSGNGEGERFLGEALAITDAFGDASFDTTIAGVVAIGEAVTSTATSLDFFSTSEFSTAYIATDAAGIVVDPVAGLVTSEAGDSTLFTVVLESQPTADVTIPLSSSNAVEGSPAVAALTFTPADWNIPQDVVVHGGNDFVIDGNQSYQIIVEPAVSSDLHYSGRDGDDVDLTNTDNDVAGVTVTPVSGLTTDEAGATPATFTVQLDSEPAADVTIALASNNVAEATADLATLTFTAADWNVPKTVTVTGVDDFVADGDQNWTVVLDAAASADPNYDTLDPADVDGTNTDDDVVGVSIAPVSGLTTDESGATATFAIHLTSLPAADVTFTLSSSNAAEGTIDLSTLTFTPGDWNIDQTVTITGVDDIVVDGDVAYTIVTDATSSSDPTYAGLDPANVDVTNADNDVANVSATPSADLLTDETGATASFDVVLTSQPAADVSFAVTSSNTAEGVVSPATITFTPSDWNVPQTVTVTGVDDFVMDGDVAYDVVLNAIVSADPNFSGVDPADINASNADNDVAGITVTPTGGLVTTEAGGTESFTVVLDTKPVADVTITLDTDTPTEGTVDIKTLTFTSVNWDSPQTVTATGVNDFVVDGDTPFSIVTNPATSTDPNYDTFDANDVFATNTDNDVAGFTVTPTAGLITTEAAGTATFTVMLTSQPTADVLIAVNSSDAGEGTPDQGFLNFTSSDWNVAQTVTVTGVNDDVVDGDIAYGIQLSPASSADLVYDTVDPDDVALTNTDNDVAGVSVTPVAGLVTTEAGGIATFTVVLTSQPLANVVVPVVSGTPAEGVAAPASLTFTAANWNVARTVTVTGVNDLAVDGDVAYTVAVQPAVSTDPAYSGLDGADVAVTNNDNDVAGATVAPVAGLITTEAGGTATFTVRLTSQPSSDVVMTLASDNLNEGTVVPASLTFTPANWNVDRTVTVTGVDDAVQDGSIVYHVVLDPAASADPNYSGYNPADVTVSNSDDDAAGIAVSPLSGLVTTEAGGGATFTLVLGSMPTADVSIALSSDDPSEGTVTPASVTFTAANWNVAQTVTVTGVDDAIADGAVSYAILTAAAVSSDPNYNGVDAGDVAVTNNDDDAAGITVSPTAGLVTTEAGGTASFDVVLASQPTADVAIAVASSNTAEGTVSASGLTFTAANWNVAQTVTVTGVNDFVQDGPVAYQVALAAAVSSDPVYNATDPSDVAVSNTDDDAAGITVSPTTGLVTTEAGGTASFDVVLTSQPTADVAIAVASNNTAEGTVSPSGLTFTAANWNVAQTVMVTGVNDAVQDGDIAYAVTVGIATSGDILYNGSDPSDVALTNTDNDVASITVTPIAGLVTTEAGGTASFGVVLDSQPTADVIIPVASSNLGEGTVSSPSLTFTAANWNIVQTVTLTGVNDLIQDGVVAYQIIVGAAASSDPFYNGTDPADVSAVNSDDDVADISVTPAAGLVTTEAGGTATFAIVLASQPTADVTIGLSSDNAAEGTVSPASLTFTAGNWNVVQTVTVTGVNDFVQDGAVAYGIITTAATSSDPVYSGMNAADVGASNADDDAAGITVSPSAGLVTTEAGGTASFAVTLTSQPTADVVITLASDRAAECVASPSTLTFTAGNWNVAQSVTLTGVDDAVADGAVGYSIVLAPATSADPNYSGTDPSDVLASNSDNDVAGISVAPVAGLTTSEAGGTATFNVVLDSQPLADVTIPVASSNTAEGTVSTASVTFTAANWNVSRTITVTGVDDAIQDGNISYNIVLGTSSSADPLYDAIDVIDVSVVNSDDDAAGINVTPVAGLITTEAGGAATFTVALGSRPVADVTIPVASSNSAEGTVSAASLTFTAANWNLAQTVTVTGVNDVVQDGSIAYTVTLGLASSSDPVYAGVDPADVSVTNNDDDTRGITVTPVAGLITTEAGGTAAFTVVLTSQPLASVSIPVASNDTAEGTISAATVTFTAANWNIAQTLTVTGVNDAVQDGNIAYTITLGTASSSDPVYSGLDPADVSATNNDDDTRGITVTPVAGLTTTEAGGSAAFTVVLTSQPLASVSIPVSSNNTAEGTVSWATLTFTAANWNVAQSVTVTGINDFVQDGAMAYTIVLGAATSSDPGYSGLDPADVAVINADDDATAITVTPTAGLTTTEAGGSSTFTVVMTAQPTANVVIPVSSSDPTEGTVSAVALTFTTANWNVAQAVTVTGVDDAIADGAVAYNVVLGASVSADANSSGIDPADVSVTNTDDDAAAITVSPVAGLVTTEAGGSASFTVVLTSQPVADVTIPVSSSNLAEGSVSPASLTFTPANWNLAQSVTVTGVDDAVVDGPVAFSIVTAAAVSSDARYSGAACADVAVMNTDNDAAGVTVTPVAGLITTEAGGSAPFSIVLQSQPVADVGFALSSTDATEGTVSPSSVTFTASNWNLPQVVTVTGVNDPVTDGDVGYSIITAAAASSDPLYSGMNPADVSVTNTDNAALTSVTLELVPDRSRIQQGQPVGFRLSVRNRTAQAIDDIALLHVLPVRFASLKGTLSMNGTLIADQPGATQTLQIPRLAAFQDLNGDGLAGPGEPGYAEFRWQLVPGAGASTGSYVDQVSATSGCPTCVVAQAVSATVRVQESELFTRSTLLGRVFEDRDRDGQQSANEPGIPNARVVMDDGTWVSTDAHGMFHVPDLESGPRVVKMDLAQVGAAAIPTTDVAQVVNIAPGLLANVRFGVSFPRDTVTVGRSAADGLAISARDPEGTLGLNGNITRSTLTLNGIVIPVTPTSTKLTLPAGEPHYPAVTLGSLAVSVDALGRFETTVPNPGDDTLVVALVDGKGRVAEARVRLPRLDILSPRGEVRLPYGQASDDMRLAAGPGVAGEAVVADANGDVASGGSAVAWTTLRGRTDARATVQVNGRTAAVADDGGFAVEVPLHVGENNINVVARDAQGLSNQTNIAVQVSDRETDGKPVVAVDATPELSLYLPPQGVALKSNALNLTGRTHPGYRVIVNGDTANVNSDGSFSRRIMLAEGSNKLNVQVLDGEGRKSSVDRELEVRSPKMFLVALADGVVGKSSGAAFLRKGDDKGTYTEGRLAWNLRGWVAGRYLLTSAFDSRRRDFGSLFKNLDDNGRDRLLTNIDPDRLYPVFGDSGSIQNSNLQGGRLFVGLQGEAVRASLGSFPIALDEVELAGFRRTLYGAQMRIGKAAGGEALPSGTSLAVFGAQASHVHVHDALEATGGTLYYLSHGEVLEGSAQVTLVVRDRVTGLQLARLPQRLGTDVIVKELEGRVQFTRPISSVWDDGSLIGNGRLQGHPVNIEVDYETRGSGAEKTAMGGRLTQAVGSALTLGGTVVDDQSGNGDYRLRGTDFTLKVAPGTRLTAEVATSSGTTGRAFSSTDGGLGYSPSDSSGTDSGIAWKTSAEVDLGRLFDKPGRASVTGYVRKVESGFVSDGERDGIALDRSGVRGTLNAGRWGSFSSRFDRETRPEMNQFRQLRGTDLYGMQWRQDGKRVGAAAEFEQRNVTRVLQSEQRNSAAAIRMWWRPVEKLKTTVEHQQALAGDKATTSALALEWRALSNLSLEARGSAGEQGKTLRGGATMTVGAKQFYVREEHTDATGGVRNGTLFGMQAPLGPESRVYSEYQWQRDPLGDHGVSVTGIEQAWRTSSGVALQVAGEHGTRGGASGQHGTVSGQLSYKGALPLSGSTRAEARRMMGSAYSRQMLSSTRLELALPSGFTVLSDLRMSMSRRREQMNLYETPNRFTESSIGLAWRAPRSDAFQAIGRWTRLADRRGAGVNDSLGIQTVLGVAALEATTRILPGVEWAVKGATRLAEDARPGSASAVAHSSLFASRLDYQIMRQPLRLGVEYRILSQRESSDHRSGWLQELSYDANQHMRFGLGYNFSRFSGDPLVRQQDSARGWFVRAQSRY